MSTTRDYRLRAATLVMTGALGPVALAGLVGCGSSTAAPGASGATKTAAQPAPPQVPPGSVVIARRGGIAGLADALTIDATGAVRGKVLAAEVSCAVPGQWLAGLRAGLATQVMAPVTTEPTVADALQVTISTASGRLDLGDGNGPSPVATAARALLNDAALAPGQRSLCR